MVTCNHVVHARLRLGFVQALMPIMAKKGWKMKVKKIEKKRGQSHYDWDVIIGSACKSKTLSVKMGSSNSAGATRVRLLNAYDGVDIHTSGDQVLINLA